MAPVNPHAETYQGKTQFSGPVRAGTRWDGPNADYVGLGVAANPIAVNKLANAGYVVCSQSAALDQVFSNTTASDIVLPAGSMIISMQVICTKVFSVGTGAQDVLRIVTRPTESGYEQINDDAAGTMDMDAIGVYNFTPGASGTRASVWKNVNNSANYTAGDDVDIRYDSDVAGDGRAILTISYIPGLNL